MTNGKNGKFQSRNLQMVIAWSKTLQLMIQTTWQCSNDIDEHVHEEKLYACV